MLFSHFAAPLLATWFVFDEDKRLTKHIRLKMWPNFQVDKGIIAKQNMIFNAINRIISSTKI